MGGDGARAAQVGRRKPPKALASRTRLYRRATRRKAALPVAAE